MNRKRKEPEEKLLAEAAAVLGLPPDQVLFQTGHEPCDRDRRRRAAALAELRAAVFLKAEGFADIRLVPTSEKLTADILASRGATTYAFEVRCVTARSSFGAGGRADPAAVLAAKFTRKIKQANASRKRGGLDRSAVVLVVEGARDLPGLARAAYEGAGAPAGAHACVLCGNGGGVWPPWV